MTNVDATPLVVPVPRVLEWSNRLAFRRQVEEHIAAGEIRLVLDLAGTGYVDSAGLGLLLSLTKRAKDAGGWLALAGLNEDLVALLEMTGLDEQLLTVALRRDADVAAAEEVR